MGRRGRTVSGWLVVDKPAGIGSTPVVARVRRALDAAKAGHAGTLDPDATGVLAVALGEATKTVPFVAGALKTYEFTVRFGTATSTDDAAGAVLETRAMRPTDAEIEATLPLFRGDILQTPPQVSAVKVAGSRAYDLAREGRAMNLAPRPLHVAALDLVARPNPDRALLSMTCGKGGYVRSVARDLGAMLGCLAHVEALRRTRSGPWTAADGLSLEQIDALGRDALERRLRPLAEALAALPELRCAPGAADRLRHGGPGAVLPGAAALGDLAWASEGGEAVAVGTYRGGELHPTRVFAPLDRGAGDP